ncbi:hypothetical protein LUZ61_016072 [Rhynchospora tenuis]|uniref:NB-ARC domain-containing protein n=1 Tax=Rhynchospora tenuis TaxID=198213 RepID=A0AAD5Z4U2_9POAL|nr:hypothetical protein LUZ61_016072 [Rhynchospora tenuis]
MTDAILNSVLNKISNTLRRGIPTRSIVKLFKREPILHEFERHLRNFENEFTALKVQLLEGSFHVHQHELDEIRKVALDVEDIITTYAYFLARVDDLSVKKQRNTVTELNNRIRMVPTICLRNPRCAHNEQLIQRGIETEQNGRLTKWLMDSAPGRTIISVWGTRSESKKKFVKKVCEDHAIKNNFGLYAYVSIGKCSPNQQLLESIADQLREGGHSIESGDPLIAIRSCLQNKRYLIILDGFKDKEVWSTIDSAFPQNVSGSKVIITTHSESIALLADENHIIKMHQFTDLPSELQHCFLYCGLFPRNYFIETEWITGLWIAEGFVELDYHDKTLEEIAGHYLKELIEYSQFKVVKKDIEGNVKEFIVQDYETLSASRLENFGVIFCDSGRVKLGQNMRHVSIEQSNESMKFDSTEKILSFFLFDKKAPHSWIVNALSNFKYLQTLCLRNTKTLTEVPNAIYQLYLLRCLDLAFTKVREIKSSVQKLNKLQTLNLRHTLVSQLPKEVVHLTTLQHLYADYWIEPNSFRASTIVGDISNLTSLQTLRKVKLNGDWVTKLKKLKKLRNLFIMVVEQKFVEKLWESLLSMPDLNKLGIVMCTDVVLKMVSTDATRNLEKLYLEGRLEERAIRAISDQFKMLKKFCIVMSGLCSDPLPFIFQMDSLVNLQIKKAYDVEKLTFSANWFPNLKKLHLGDMPQLSHVIIENGTMRNLQCLRFSILTNLKEVPVGLKYLEKLEDIISL